MEWLRGPRRAAPDPPPRSVPSSFRCSDCDLHSRPSPIPSDLTTVNPISYQGSRRRSRRRRPGELLRLPLASPWGILMQRRILSPSVFSPSRSPSSSVLQLLGYGQIMPN
ncbi:unnamed protein product [Urochloa humidicola]